MVDKEKLIRIDENDPRTWPFDVEDPGLPPGDVLPRSLDEVRHQRMRRIASEHGIPLSDWKPILPMLEGDLDF
jgi:hypothetical protein